MALEERLDELERRIDQRFERIEQAIERLTRYTMDFRTETVRQFELVDNRLDMLSATMSNFETRLVPLTKWMLDSGSLASQLKRDQVISKDFTADLAARMSRLEEKVAKVIDPAA